MRQPVIAATVGRADRGGRIPEASTDAFFPRAMSIMSGRRTKLSRSVTLALTLQLQGHGLQH